jgi:hypothetical protein
MAGAKEASEKTLHGFAVDNDVRGIEDLLIIVPDLNLNEMDEYVSLKLWLLYCFFSLVEPLKLFSTKGIYSVASGSG